MTVTDVDQGPPSPPTHRVQCADNRAKPVQESPDGGDSIQSVRPSLSLLTSTSPKSKPKGKRGKRNLDSGLSLKSKNRLTARGRTWMTPTIGHLLSSTGPGQVPGQVQFKGDLEVDLEGDSKGDFKQDM